MPETSTSTTETVRDGRRVVIIRRPVANSQPATIPDDFLEQRGRRRWTVDRFKESLGQPPSVVTALFFFPSLLLGQLLIGLGLLLRILPRNFMSRHNGNDMTMIKPLSVGFSTIILAILITLVALYGVMGVLICGGLFVLMDLWAFKEHATTKLDQEHDYREYLRTRDQAVMVTETIYAKEMKGDPADPAGFERAISFSTGHTENDAELYPRKKIWRFI